MIWDALYRLSFSLNLYEKRLWEATDAIVEMCKTKGASDSDCHNYVMVLQSFGNQLYACGTYAFSPQCSWRQMDNLNITKLDKGVAKCPFNPHANITTLMTDNGKLFIGSTTDFQQTDPAILRADISKDKEDNRILRTDQYNSKWLNSPQFVGSFEAGDFVYFVFREAAVEYINCGKIIYSRIARVCKSDPGGQRGSRDNWTSFAKARLNCSLPGEYPFYFNEVQGIQYSMEESTLFATFTTPVNSIHGSAICAFNLSSINSAFNGAFKHQETASSTWERKELEHRNQFECKFSPISSMRHDLLMGSHRFQLMDESVQPITMEPLFMSALERFNHIALDTVATKMHNKLQVLYISTQDNLIKKLSILPRKRETCVIEIWQPEVEKNSKILTLQYLKQTESLYIGTEHSVLRIPSNHCSRHLSRLNCLNAMDPYCGWNDLQQECTPPPDGEPLKRFWFQQANECPLVTAPIDGGFSAWSEWFKCNQHTDDHRHESSNLDSCLCRTRVCNNPSPGQGGLPCTGTTISVTNCTVHGKWSEWSAWSACSQTCGIAVKSRRRYCGSPEPSFGGRTCVGPDRLEMYCTNLPPCPEPRKSIDGGWGPFGAWSECSQPCGAGFRFRRRICNDPIPDGGLDCPGCAIDYELCNTQPCPELQRLGPWTPWLQRISSNVSIGEHLEKRFRYMCKLNGTDANSIKVFKAKEESRICVSDGSCHRISDENNDLGFSEWSSWSTCTKLCGGGQQFRTRICSRTERNSCEGSTKMTRVCNTRPCEDSGSWSDWSPCNVDGERSRTRRVLSLDADSNKCEEKEIEIRSCTSYLNDLSTAGNASTYFLFLFIVLLCGSNSFIYVYMKKRYGHQREIKNIGSPCFDSFPNQYSSLPTKEDRPRMKQQSSFIGSGGSSVRLLSNGHGTLTKSNNVNGHQTPKVLSKCFAEIDTATIKRNSHGLNNIRPLRTVDDDKF
ncbi:semaphorin-5A isoform X2 [Sitodiplosis mosellana]|uniref:semaphorin-5A isoform X2 n=1 Tax=Sitodiplosis mosellana TaxID=263140 RepID=UPI0024441764|nr:semaphorin-5A isoform X2 [Sitodiplosis mosellana]